MAATLMAKYYVTQTRKYGLLNFVWDCFLIGLTGGLWLVWIFIREMRMRSSRRG